MFSSFKNLLFNDTPTGSNVDEDGDRLTVSIVSGPSQGTIDTLRSWGGFDYTPNTDFVGTDSFVYEITDGVNTSQATATIDVTAANNAAPELIHQSNELQFATDMDTQLYGPALGRDIEGDRLTLIVDQSPRHGTIEQVGDSGEFVYTPNQGFFGLDSVALSLTDGLAQTATFSVEFVVNFVGYAVEYFVLDDSTEEPNFGVLPAGWTWELDTKGAIIAVAGQGATIQQLADMGYASESLPAEIPESRRIDVTAHFPEVVGDTLAKQQALVITPEIIQKIKDRLSSDYRSNKDDVEAGDQSDEEVLAFIEAYEFIVGSDGSLTIGDIPPRFLRTKVILASYFAGHHHTFCHSFTLVATGLMTKDGKELSSMQLQEAFEKMNEPDLRLVDTVEILVRKNGIDETPDLGDVMVVTGLGDQTVHSATVLGVGANGAVFVIERQGNEHPVTVIGVDFTDPDKSWKIYDTDR